MEIAEDVVMGVFEEGKGADERAWLGTLAELSALRAAQALSAATRALDSLHTHRTDMQCMEGNAGDVGVEDAASEGGRTHRSTPHVHGGRGKS